MASKILEALQPQELKDHWGAASADLGAASTFSEEFKETVNQKGYLPRTYSGTSKVGHLYDVDHLPKLTEF
ncbi:hypothetical protein TTRE_0000712401 [Trichuris trichiura]|uniref:Uncharacterized protein n=1 Tax=Trichuris trichiura TaxID=36087 RepID=A0A077ZG70_TRITR|nr:hypothetical protein TTRE_0000712401 [Trichuris trichiura]